MRPASCSRSIPETGELQWKLYTVPMNEGDPGPRDLAEPRRGAAWRRAGLAAAAPTIRKRKLYIFGTGNPTPAYTPARGEGDNLFTCSLIAVNVDTGKMAWYYQTSPHDMHDWDSAQTPVLVDALFKGRMRKMVMTAARNGYFFVLDRVTGEHLLTSKYGSATNWVKELDEKGRPERDPEKDATVGGALVSPTAGGTINWEPPAFSPETGLFYVAENNAYSIFYLTDTDPRGSMGLGGKRKRTSGRGGSFLTAIDYKTGKAAWRHKYRRRAAAAAAACSRRLASWCSPATAAATSSPTMPRPASRCGTRGSATSPIRRRPTCSTAASTCWSPPATRCGRSVCIDAVSQTCSVAGPTRRRVQCISTSQRADAAAEVVELHVRMIGQQRHRHGRVRRCVFEIISVVSRWPNGLSCLPACQMETFSAFHVSTGPTVIALRRHDRDIAAAAGAGVLRDRHRVQVDDARRELAILRGRGRRVLVFALARQADR